MNETTRIEYSRQLKREKDGQGMNRYSDFIEARLLIAGEMIGIRLINQEIKILPTEFDSVWRTHPPGTT